MKKKIEVELPFLNTSIEIYGIQKTIKLDLSRELKGKAFEATFEIEKKNEKFVGIPKKIVLMGFYIRRAIHRGTSYVEDSSIYKTKDVVVRIKPFLITRKKVHRSVRKALREKTKEIIEKFCLQRSAEEIFSSILKGQLQKELSTKLKKIYPLSFCEIRVVEKEK